MKRSFFLFLTLLIITMLFCSCTQSAVTDKADELRINSWSGNGEYSTKVFLSFDGSKASFNVQSMGGAKTSFYGDCFINDNKIRLTDNRLKKSFEFNYDIEGDKMTLTYSGGTINLHKD
ncbi:hypothetical protein [Ruminococcus sp. zg-921]|uniref:hypothetical protein n=1 Tax=Ruminococcus sp. zg-921 TaxID=2678506 RepID=UPI00210A09F1|nr:hypothetical protein [Ruminococcus sp. zg-921]MCQ4114980.1 hypothetical protein [Ruminococcus sp. zg-921]